MADKFERQKSTRWVKADMPSYGDEWGNDYDDEDDQRMASSESLPVTDGKPQVSSSTLVLSIDHMRAQSDNDDDDDDDEEADETENYQAEGRHGHYDSDTPDGQYQDTSQDMIPEPEPQYHQSTTQSQEPKSESLEKRALNVSTSSAPGQDLMPPTPTFSTHQSFPHSPETTMSERSFASDADSIQMEPDSLNLFRKAQTQTLEPIPSEPTRPKPSEPTQPEPYAEPHAEPTPVEPETTTPSSENKQFLPSNTSSVYSSQVPSRADTGAAGSSARAHDPLVLSIDRMNLNHSDNDSDSSDFEERRDVPEESDHSLPSSPLFKDQPSRLSSPVPHQDEHTAGRRVDTEALDSLINDLSQMESSSMLDYGSDDERKRASYVSNEQKPETSEPEESRHSDDISRHSGDISRDTTDISREAADNSRDSAEMESVSEIVSMPGNFDGDIEQEHQNFMSSMRRGSVRKAPAFSDNDPDFVNASNNSSQTNFSWTQSVNISRETLPAEGAPQRSESEPNSAANTAPSALFASLPSLPPPSIPGVVPGSRRESTVSNATFNMGNWTPNTNKYRDQFVNDNDNESQMNVSLYNKTDSVYNRFTGNNSGYAESFTNSSCVSVPDTIENNLHEIREDNIDTESQGPDVMSMVSRPGSLGVDQTKNRSAPSVPSVLREHPYEGGTFQEEPQTPAQSADNLSEIKEESSEKRVPSSEMTDALKHSAHASSEAVPKPAKQAYPVSDWKKIMTKSQPADRIQLLKKAKLDEENYDTGLSYWLQEVLKSTESAPQIQIGKLASQAYQNAQHNDLRRHTSIRSKVSSVRDKMDTGNFGIQASNLGRKFFSKGKKLMKQGSE